MSMIKTEDVCNSFGKLDVLDHVSLTVEPKEVVCIIGPSGAGKSTFLRTLNNLEHINHGKIYIEDKLLAHYEQGERKLHLSARDTRNLLLGVGMVFQRFNLFPHKTALENTMLAPMNVRHKTEKEAREIGIELLNRVGLPSFPAGSSSALPSRGHLPWNRASCFLTSRRLRSTRSWWAKS